MEMTQGEKLSHQTMLCREWLGSLMFYIFPDLYFS